MIEPPVAEGRHLRACLPDRLVVKLAAGATAVCALAATADAASASAPPVGPLPAAKVTTVKTTPGQLVSIALPTRRGYVWRVARLVAARVVRQVGEGDVGRVVVLVFAAVGRGRAAIVLAETRGETTKAYRAVKYDVTVR
jgi:hypothetical protein